jgi:hypothetical protein
VVAFQLLNFVKVVIPSRVNGFDGVVVGASMLVAVVVVEALAPLDVDVEVGGVTV